MKHFVFGCLLAIPFFTSAQSLSEKLSWSVKKLEEDTQFKHATFGMYVVETKTGKSVYEKNIQTGLAPASCQKVITSASAFELLGKDFRYKTFIGIDSSVNYNAGSLFLIGTGDPTLGSWRWKNTVDTVVLSKITAALKRNKLLSFEKNLYIDDVAFGLQPLPDGWIWEDIGNYFGAACFGFNWHENQYDLILQPGQKEGYPATIMGTNPKLPGFSFTNTIRTGARNSGDQAYIYTVPFSTAAFTRGTIPLQQNKFTISGSIPDPAKAFAHELMEHLKKENIIVPGEYYSYSNNLRFNQPVAKATQYIDSILSPSLDSMNYWFLKKSINVYGEAFLKSIAASRHSFTNDPGIYDRAIALVQDFWKERGIEKSALNIMDGSGLSPANRVTVHALVTVMQYTRQQNWFSSFYNALPELNAIKMKDGYIGGVRSYTGYVKSKSGIEYTFSFIVNNFAGSPASVREKMWKVLDLLK